MVPGTHVHKYRVPPGQDVTHFPIVQAAKWKDLLRGVAAAICVQLVLGSPFLLHYPVEYVSKSFELSRIFLLEWSVNWSFLPENVFKSKGFARFLLVAHASLLLAFAQLRWCKAEGGLLAVLLQRLKGNQLQKNGSAVARIGNKASMARHYLLVLFTGNFIGILCARTLHFQFYSWYFHTIPFLLWRADISMPLRLTLFGCIESMWNVFPTRALSSGILLFCHMFLLVQLWFAPDWAPATSAELKDKKV